MQQNILHALQTLYGNTEHSVCAVDRSFRIVWQNHGDAAQMVDQLSLQLLAGSESLYDPTLPADRTYFITVQQQRLRCTLQPLGTESEAVCLLFFEPVSDAAGMTAPELRAILAQHADACRELAAILVHSVRPTVSESDEIGLPLDEKMRQRYLQTQRVIYTLLRKSLCSSELLWYENFAGIPCSELAVQDIGSAMRRLSNQVCLISGNWLEVQNEEIDLKLYAMIDVQRLNYVILTQISAAIAKYCVSGVLSCKAYQQEELIRIELRFCPHRDGDAKAIPVQSNPILSEHDSDQAIVRRFCDVFRVSITELSAPDCIGLVFTIPALPAGSSCSILRTSQEPYGVPDRFSVSHIVLSDILPAETFFETAEELL